MLKTPTTHSSPLNASTDRVLSVLYIEDVRTEQISILQSMSHSGIIADMVIHKASTMTEGMVMLEKETIDVILLDLDLPDSKSLKSISLLKSAFPDIPIVILSGHSEEAIATEALMMGADEFLIKGECSGIMIKQTLRQAVVKNGMRQKQPPPISS